MNDPEQFDPSPWHITPQELDALIGYFQMVQRMRARGYSSTQEVAAASLANGAVGT